MQAAPRAVLDDEALARDLSLMLQSGLPLLEALTTVRERASTTHGVVLDDVIQRLRQGESLSSALSASGAVRAALLATVRASERTGDMPDALQRFARHAAHLRTLRSKLQSALLYPALLAAVSLLVVVFLLLFVVPRFAGVMEGMAGELPTLTRLMFELSKLLQAIPAPVWALAAAGLIYVGVRVVQAWRAGLLMPMLARFGARLPLLSTLLAALGHVQFTRGASMLVRSGMPALRAMDLCAELLVPQDRRLLQRGLALATSGAPLALTLYEQGFLDALGYRVLRVAERTGELAAALERLAVLQDEALERRLERIGRLIEPALMLFIGLVVGGIVVLMYLPIFQLAATL